MHGEEAIYSSPWVRLSMVDVEKPDGTRIPHHVVRSTADAAGVVVERDGLVLLIHRHRFTTGTWGWEVPAGRVDPGEAPAEAGRREVEEETGWRPGPVTAMFSSAPMNGTCDQRFHLFHATGAEHVGDPTDPNEADRIEWFDRDGVRALLRDGEVLDGMSVSGLAWWLAGLHA